VGLLLSFPIINALLGWNAQTIILEIGVFMLLALGLNLLLGWAGLLDLGYLVGFGVGAYLTALLLPLQPQGLRIGTAPDLRGLSYFSFGLVIYLTVLWKLHRRER